MKSEVSQKVEVVFRLMITLLPHQSERSSVGIVGRGGRPVVECQWSSDSIGQPVSAKQGLYAATCFVRGSLPGCEL